MELSAVVFLVRKSPLGRGQPVRNTWGLGQPHLNRPLFGGGGAAVELLLTALAKDTFKNKHITWRSPS